MLNIDVLIQGNEFKDAKGDVWEVTEHVSDDNELYVKLKRSGNEELQKLLIEE